MNLTEEQVLSLAPDDSSKKAGLGLAGPSKWVIRAYNDLAIWGECQGSGKNPYQTQIDTTNIAFKCSCPSRKFPCKHGIGLMLLYTRQQSLFTNTDAPSWVSDWLDKRNERQEKQAEKKDKPVDEAAQAKRLQARESKVEDGIAELNIWIKDIVRNGLVNIPERESSYFLNMAKRMVDAQAPGLAGMIRYLSEINFYNDGWQTPFLDQLGKIYLITEAFKNLDKQDENVQQDIRTWIGFTQNQETLKEQTGTLDTWLILAKQTTEDENITTERYWLYGTKTSSYALVLQFIVRGIGAQVSLMPGTFIQAELIYFPSTLPLRAIIKRQISTSAVADFKGFNSWQQIMDDEAKANSILPFRSERPYIIHNVKPVLYNGTWWLQDANKNMMAVRNEQQRIWKLLAISGGKEIDTAVIGSEDSFEPIGLWQNNEYSLL